MKQNNKLYKIKTGGIPIGMADLGLEYKTEQITLGPGESLLMFTDGITEAMNSLEEMYEDDRLESFFMTYRQAEAGQFVNSLITDVQYFVDGAEQSDDITVLIIKRLA
jgi:sigma-B regulation protein RsbU (phosphoserine phosphatase)